MGRPRIGTAMLAWSLTRATAALKRVPERARVAPRVGARPGQAASTALFEAFGYSLVRILWAMTIDLATPPAAPAWPTGIHLQPYHHPQDPEAVYRCYRDAVRDHWGFLDVPFEQGLKVFRHVITALRPVESDLWFLAMEGSEMVGMSICRRCSDDDPEMGWVDILGVRMAWRRWGLGSALPLHSFDALRQRGAHRAGLGVDAGSLTGRLASISAREWAWRARASCANWRSGRAKS
jgi:mycothiol synthase